MLTTTDGSKTLYTFAPEVTPGTPVVGAFQTLRSKIGVKLDLKRDTFMSKERRSDRMESALSYGNRSGSGSLPVEWSYGSYDAFLEAVMGGTWTADVLKIGNLIRTQTFEETAAELGITEQTVGVQPVGFSISQKSNGIADGDIFVIFRDVIASQTKGINLAYDSAAKTITRSSAGFITVDGWTVGKTVCGRGNTDAGNNNAIPWTITTLTDTVMTFTVAVGIVTKIATADIVLNNSTLATSVVAASTSVPFDSFTGQITEGGVVIGYVTGWDLKVENANQLNFACGSPTAQSSSLGTIKISGNLTVYYIDEALRKKFLAGTSSSLSLVLGSVALTKAYTLGLGTVKYTSNTRNDAEMGRTETMAFSATYDTGTSSTLVITRTP